MITTEEYNARLAANETAVKAAIRKMGFKPDRKYYGRDCYNLGTLRIAFFSDDERLEIYAFDGVPGSSCLKYEIPLTIAPSMPVEVVTSTIAAVVAAELR